MNAPALTTGTDFKAVHHTGNDGLPPDGKVLIPSAGGFTAQQLIDAQHAKNISNRNAYQKGRFRNLSLRALVQNVRDTLEGVFNDAWGNTRPLTLSALLTSNNRLRGIGVLLIFVAVLGLLLELFVGSKNLL